MRIGPVLGAADPGIGWFTVFGWGIRWKDTTRHHVFFSERNGYRRVYRIGKWSLGFIKRGR